MESLPEQQSLRPKPAHRIDEQAKSAWRITGTLSSLFYWLAPVGYWLVWQNWEWPFELIYPLGGLVLLYTLLSATLIPAVRWKRWRYEVTEDEIDLQRGLLVVTRTLIPIQRVQHVDTRQGPIYSNYDLSSVTITTAATTHEIPALTETVADEVRNRISALARKAKEDV